MISANEFIDILEKKDLLDPEMIDDLRRRVDQSMAPVSAALLAKRLVDKGHLSRKLAQRLLDRAESEAAEPPAQANQPVEEDVPEAADIGLAPLDDEKDEEVVEEVADLEMTEEEDWGLQELEEDKPAPSASPPQAPPVQPAAPVPPASPAPPAEQAPPTASLVEGLEEIEDTDAPFGELEEAAAGEALEEPFGGSRSGRKGKSKKPGKGAKANVWDSSLLLIGGGSLLLLIIIGVVLVFVLSGRGADEMIAQAHEYYAAGSYTKAIDSYSKFLEDFPDHPEAGTARIRLSLAKMRQVVGSDWPKALEVAKEEIPLISGEETFAADARPELASMLPDIADGLATKAHEAQDSKTADLAEEGLALVEKYLPSSARPNDRLEEIEALIALTRREIARSERLETTVAAIGKAAEEGRTEEGYELRRALLKQYPVLEDEPTLAEAVRAVSQAEQAAVEKIEKSQQAVTDEPQTRAVATIALAQRSVSSAVSGVDNQLVYALAGGAVYGLEATQGKVLWRRDVGFEKNVRAAQFPPTPISGRPGSDPLLVSRSREEVLRVEASTGNIRWRFPVGEAFDAHPVVFEDRVLVATRSGRLLFLDLESGDSSDYIQFPQPLPAGPTPDPRRNAIYQMGEHSSLFVISAADGSCENVVYLGHEPGSIVVRPVLVSRYLLVCENDEVNDSLLKILDLDPQPEEGEEQAPPIRLVQEVRLRGHVHTTPIVSGSQVLVVTDAGAISVFRLTGVEGQDPLSLSADGTTAGDDRKDLVRYAHLAEGRLWIADTQLTQYAVRSSESRLNPSWIANEGSISVQPPTVAGDAVIQVRHRRGLPGVAVSAVNVDDGSVRWETTLAAPAASAPIVDRTTKTLIATTAVGGLFQLQPPPAGETSLRDDPTQSIPPAQIRAPIAEIVRHENGMIAMIPAEEPREIPVFVPGKTEDEARLRSLLLSAPLTGEPVSFAGGLLAPCETGQVFLVEPETGENIAEPFQPELEAGRKYRWSRPAAFGDVQFVIADDGGGVYRVGMSADQLKHLEGAATLRLDEPIVSPLAVLGDRVYGVDRTDSLVQINLPGLIDPAMQPLGAKCVFGPVAVGEHVLLVTNDDLLHVVDAEGNRRSDALPYGRPLGGPEVDGSDWLFASPSGVVWRVDSATGEELAQLETGLALGSGVALFGSQLIAAGHDGTFYLLEKP